MKDLMTQSTNKINIVGKLLDTVFREGTTRDGKPYESCTFNVRVRQTIEGVEEIDEIPISTFASKYTNAGTPHPGFKSIQEMKGMKTVQEHGEEEATVVRISTGSIAENYYVSRAGQLIDGWRINASFVNGNGNAKGSMATFNIDIFILDMHDEEDKDGDPTGRLIIRGGIVQYGGKLDIIDFIVEDPAKVEYISRNWNINDTVNARGHIRYTAKEAQNQPIQSSSWGEEIPDIPTTQMVRELIITTGSDEGFEEDFSYDSTDIKKAFNVRKAVIEQMQVNASASPTKKAAPKSKYSWE